MEFKSYIMDCQAVSRALSRISHEIVERNGDGEELCIVGIMRRGAPLADILAARVRSLGAKVEIGYLDITLYRDDLSEDDDQPRLNETKIDFSVSGKTVIMVDDVLYTGRTARAAMDAIISLGRPARRPQRQGAQRAADSRRLCGQKCADLTQRSDSGQDPALR